MYQLPKSAQPSAWHERRRASTNVHRESSVKGGESGKLTLAYVKPVPDEWAQLEADFADSNLRPRSGNGRVEPNSGLSRSASLILCPPHP